jgi:tripartite-type tricarboxylate transporter receptor subunit TctC
MTKGLLAVVLASLVGFATQVQSYPDRGVTIVVPASPGGVTDFIGRLLAQSLTSRWGKSVIVENRAGGGTLTGAVAVARASPDGHELLVMPLGVLFNSILSKTNSINFERDLIPISVVADQSFCLVVNADLPVADVKGLIAYAKQKPGELSYGTVGPGSLPDIAAELLKSMSGTDMVGIPYGGNTPAMTDLLAGRIHLLFLPLGSALPFINEGKVRAIGVSGLQRDEEAPQIPTIAEDLPGFVIVTWQALMTTGGTPMPVVEKLNKEVNEITSDPDTLAKLKKLHLTRRPSATVAENRDFVLAEVQKWRPILERIGVSK